MTATKPNRSQSDNSILTEEEERTLDLDADEQAILRYVRSNGSTTQAKLAYRTRLPESHVNDILRFLGAEGLVDVRPGFATVQVSCPSRGEADA